MSRASSRKITKKAEAEFIKELKSSTGKKKVEVEVIAPAYRRIISTFFHDGEWDFEGNTDGFYSADRNLFFSLRLLIEAKFDLELRNSSDRADIVIQCIYYMKKFQTLGHAQPNVIFAGDRDQMFVLYAPPLLKYLNRPLDWSISPSYAAAANREFSKELQTDALLATYVFDINDKNFSINDVMMSLDRLSENDGEYDKIKVIPQNIRAVFDNFTKLVRLDHSDKDEFAAAVTLFITSLIGGPNAPRIDDTKRDTVYLFNGESIRVDSLAYQAFFSRYETSYSEVEIDQINGMYDVLIEEISRRLSGDFWTPTIWADKAHQMISANLGKTWRKEWTIWDPACGTKNLTRDYTDFESLYVSTLHQYELDTSSRYNPSATSFQFDFLNDDIDIGPQATLDGNWKIPANLYTIMLYNKPILFLMNPPYATATNPDETHKKGVATNAVHAQMLKEGKFAHANQQLYTQFLYRILMLKRAFSLSNVSIGIFSNDRFLTGGKSWKGFIETFQDDFVFKDGFFFNAGEFSDVQNSWGISFTLWTSRDSEDFRSQFELSILASTPFNPSSPIEKIGTREIVASEPDDLLSHWLKEHEPARYSKRTTNYVQLSGPLKINSSAAPRGFLSEDAIGYFHNNSNSVEHSGKYVGIYSSSFGSANGIPIRPKNFERVAVTFAVRKALFPVDDLWVTGHDNFRRPSPSALDDPRWPQFVFDCVVYSLCSTTGSNQSSLRDVLYQGDSLDVENEFFFESNEVIRELAENFGNKSVIRDLKTFGADERFVFSWLVSNSSFASSKAKRTLSVIRTMIKETFSFRDEHVYMDSLHSTAWDMGFRQIYTIAMNEKVACLDQYVESCSALKAAISTRAIEFGFLPPSRWESPA